MTSQFKEKVLPQFFAGSKLLQIYDKVNDLPIPTLIHYPTFEPSVTKNYGPYTMNVSPDAIISTGKFPLIIISHGNSGSYFLYRTISTYLAKHGYIVAIPEHYANNRRDNSLATSVKNLQYRPQHISMVIDFLTQDAHFSPSVVADRIAVIGHSFSGYTALALAGGRPYTREGVAVEVQKDQRVKALAIMAPAAAYFIPDQALSQVTVPILVFTAEHDQITPLAWTAEVILNGVTDKSKIHHQPVANAGHFSFISPFPAKIKRPGFLPATDPVGFDREKFHQQLPHEIFLFLDKCFKSS